MPEFYVERLAGMVRTEIDQARAAGDAWSACEADFQMMYGAGPTAVTAALQVLESEGTVKRRDDRMWVAGPAA